MGEALVLGAMPEGGLEEERGGRAVAVRGEGG